MVTKAKPTHAGAGALASKPGLALRRLRTGRSWTLADVSRRTNLPVSTLSKIENGKMSLSYDKLTRLCEGLEIDIAELFAIDAGGATPANVTGRRSITRAGDGRVIDTNGYLHWYPAADLLHKRFVPIIAELHARSLEEFGELIRHPGEEYALVLEGAVELHTDLYAPTRLEVGDSIYFDSGMGHAYLAAGPGRCRVLAICSASESQMIDVFGPEHGAAAKRTKTTMPSLRDEGAAKSSAKKVARGPAKKRRKLKSSRSADRPRARKN